MRARLARRRAPASPGMDARLWFRMGLPPGQGAAPTVASLCVERHAHAGASARLRGGRTEGRQRRSASGRRHMKGLLRVSWDEPSTEGMSGLGGVLLLMVCGVFWCLVWIIGCLLHFVLFAARRPQWRVE